MAVARIASTRRLLRWLLVLLVLDATWVIGLYAWAQRCVQNSAHEPVDAVAVLYSDFGPSLTRTSRSLDHAAALFADHPSAIVFCIGGNRPRSGRHWGGLMRDYLVPRGIPADRVICDTTSFDTRTNVQSIARLAQDHAVRSMYVIAHPAHVPRVAHYLNALLPTISAQILFPVSHGSPWAGRIDFILAAQHELLAWGAMLLPARLHETALVWLRR
jgi:uncharacterized SAM-binding protein YcdF (DUF218 family)